MAFSTPQSDGRLIGVGIFLRWKLWKASRTGHYISITLNLLHRMLPLFLLLIIQLMVSLYCSGRFVCLFGYHGKLNSFEIPVNRGGSSRNSCDEKLTSAVVVPHIYLNFVPETITEEIHREASKLLNKKGRIAVGPDGSNIYYCHNKKNIRMPVPVEYDTRVNGQIVTCLSKSCIRYK